VVCGLVGGLACDSCSIVSLCEYDLDRCAELVITADHKKIELYQDTDNLLWVSFQNRFSDAAIDCFLEPEDYAFSPRWVATLAPAAAGISEEITVPQKQLQGLAVGRHDPTTRVGGGARIYFLEIIRLFTIRRQSPHIRVLRMSDRSLSSLVLSKIPSSQSTLDWIIEAYQPSKSRLIATMN
jgi:hypothetical protein